MFNKLITWSQKEHNDLPWRKKRTLYKTLVSEIMLQQTTVGTVLNHYDRFIVQYPNLDSLATSSEEELQVAWKGLGYYRRARNLRNAAISIINEHSGKIPITKDKLIEIPGIGEYTASALIAIGRDKEALAIDANLERVLARLYGIRIEKGPKLHKEIQRQFKEKKIIPDRKQYSFRQLNEALMDLGRTYCRANKVQCDLCPMRRSCKAKQTKDPLSFPNTKKAKKAKFYELDLVKFVVKKNNSVLGYRRSKDQWLAGQTELPTFIYSSEDSGLKQYPLLNKELDLKELQVIKTSITKYKIKNYIIEIKEREFKKLKLAHDEFEFYSLDHQNFTTTAQKALKRVSKL